MRKAKTTCTSLTKANEDAVHWLSPHKQSIILLNFDQIFSGFFQNAATFRSFPKPSGGTQGSVPVPAELENVGEASDFLERRAHGRVPAAFWKNPENIWLNLAKIQQNSGKICEMLGKKLKNSKQFSNF